MMFKVISMHTKPSKHAKYNEIIRNESKKSKCSYRCRLLAKYMFAPESHILHAPSYGCFRLLKNTKPLKNI